MPKKIMPKRDYALKGYANLQANRKNNLFFDWDKEGAVSPFIPNM